MPRSKKHACAYSKTQLYVYIIKLWDFPHIEEVVVIGKTEVSWFSGHEQHRAVAVR